MQKTRIRIKNMVCRHCMEAVLGVMRELALEVSSIRLGEAEVNASEAEIDFPRMEQLLNKNGFELLRVGEPI